MRGKEEGRAKKKRMEKQEKKRRREEDKGGGENERCTGMEIKKNPTIISSAKNATTYVEDGTGTLEPGGLRENIYNRGPSGVS